MLGVLSDQHRTDQLHPQWGNVADLGLQPLAELPPNRDLLAAMVKLGVPFLDRGILDGPPAALVHAQRRVLDEVGGASSLGRRLLRCMYGLLTAHVLLEDDSNLSGTGSLLHFNDLNETERTLFLFEMLASSRAKPLTAVEVTHLKVLPLFTVHVKNESASTSQVTGSNRPSHSDNIDTSDCVSVTSCTHGVFWCENRSLLDGVTHQSLPGTHSVYCSTISRRLVALLNPTALSFVLYLGFCADECLVISRE